MTAVCTHLGCITRYMGPEEGIHCPCHGSHFSLTGEVLGGPAPAPLPRLHLEIADGELVVDTRRIVDADFFLEA